ncbi:MAG: hypothetical protein A2901_03230 [Elusimicrobia bacterium RIFCSPLOWO2_01_FULL_54_10]|nr:MAG: hypothetical protein A2901_03230 [Elusimicrobia bacterium RIFCSPLOWO2_01_FULL_54_10]
MKLSNILPLARYTFVGSFRSKIFLVLILFGVLLLLSSFLLSILGQEQEIRVLTDLGLASIEILALFTSIFLMVNLILEQIEQRTLYLVLTRSVSRAEYLLGNYFGTLAAIFACVVLMTLLHAGILLFKGWDIRAEGLVYFASVFTSFEKIVLVSALGLFFSIFSTSAVSALVFTIFLWISGHFAVELKFLAGRLEDGALKTLFKGIYYLVPHFHYLNARDIWISYSSQFGRMIAEGTLYTALYSAAALLLAHLSFRKKEF